MGLSTGAEFIITPENPIDTDIIIETLSVFLKQGRRNAIIVMLKDFKRMN